MYFRIIPKRFGLTRAERAATLWSASRRRTRSTFVNAASWWNMHDLDQLLANMHSAPQRAEVRALSSVINGKLERWLQSFPDELPGVPIDKALFINAIAARLDTLEHGHVSRFIDQLHASDFLLAQACLNGHPEALQLFESRFAAEMRSRAQRFANQRFSIEDLLQILREKLFVQGPQRSPKIGTYSGEGPLQGWVCVTALRTFLDAKRSGAQHKREEAFDSEKLEAMMAPGDDLEIAFLKKKYRADFRAAFTRALASLSSAERNILRHQWIAGLTIDQIGVIYHIHRATAARRINKARTALMHATRSELMAHLHVENDELDSIMGLISSRLDLSIQRLLGNPTQGPNP